MASIYRRTYKATVNGRTVTRKLRHYTIVYKDRNGRRRKAKGYTDKAATVQLAARLERAIAQGKEGLEDVFAEHKARAIDGHITDYLADLRAKGRDPMYVYNADKRLHILADECGWESLPDIEPNSFINWRDKRRQSGSKQGRSAGSNGAAPRTLNQYLDTIRCFCNWCCENNRMESNPLAKVSKVEGSSVRNRRALTEEEIALLLASAPEGRRLAWEVLLSTGLRVQEATDLQWQDVHADATKPYLSLRASAVKSRRDQAIPLRQDIAAKLRAIRPADTDGTDRVFPTFPCLESWKADLKAAGIAYTDALGRQVDRHAARTTLGTRLQRAGVPIRVAMELMRHSDIRLTTKVYTDPSVFDLAGAVESLPAISTAEPAKAEIA